MAPEKSKLLLIVLIPILAIIAVRIFVAQPITRPPAGPEVPPKVDYKTVAEAWSQAVRGGDQAMARQLATMLVPSGYDKIVHPAYPKLAQSESVYEVFLTDSFNRFDFQAWRDALFFKDLATQVTAEGEDSVKQAFDLVVARVEPVSKKDAAREAPWPRQIWERKHGLCDRMSWVLAEILYQLGYETQIVYLLKPGTKDSPHTILEVRKAGQVWIADPLSRKLLPNTSVEQLAADRDALAAMWPEQPVWQATLAHSILYTPSYPQDYCWRNQELQRVLSQHLPGAVPRFGEDPLTRQRAFLALRKAELGPKMKCNMMVWFYTFRPLLEDLK
jgi:hypothetical protein